MGYRERMDFGPEGYTFEYWDETKETHWKKVHAHQGIEMLYVHRGMGEIALEGSNYPLRDGTLVIFQPYQLHRVEVPVQSEASYIRTKLTFNPHVVEPWLLPFPRLAFFYRRLWKGVLQQQVFQLKDDQRLPRLLEDFQQSYRLRSAYLEEDCGLFFLTLLKHLEVHVFAGGYTAGAEDGRATRHVENMMDWVETHYKEPFQLHRMAEDLHLSPYHLSHLFKQYTGRTISNYIAARRVREACSLLISTAKPVKAISREVGGLSDTYFCQLFKKWKGVTPQAYRETVRGLF